MKKIFNTKNSVLFVSLLIGGLFAGCNDAEYSTLGTRAYLAEAASSIGTKVTVQSSGTTSTSITVSLSEKAKDDYKFKLVADQDVLDRYNKINGTNYIMLPESSYELPTSITLKSGEFTSDATNIEIQSFTEEMNSSGESYAIPLKLVNEDGKMPTTGQSSTFVIALESIFEFSAPILSGKTPVKVDMSPGVLTLSEFTVEMRFQISGFYENQALFNGGGSGDSQVYIRLEDPVGTYNLIQIVGKNTYLNAISPFAKNKWQHLAISFDGSKYLIYVNGKLDAQKDVSPGAVSFNQIGFATSGASWFRANCLMSEIRLWSKALSETQIQNNMVVISPKTSGLEAYWKMNEGTGNVFKDATGHGYTATAEGTINWVHGILSTDEVAPWN